MEDSKTRPAHRVEIRRTLNASPERIYQAWTDPAALSRWFKPAGEYEVIVHRLELRVGGAYSIEMRHQSGKQHTAYGVYRELKPSERLVFTWRWLEDTAMPDSLVTVELTARGPATDLVVRHELLESADSASAHEKGWVGCLERLAMEF